MNNFLPEFSKQYFLDLQKQSGVELSSQIVDIMFDLKVVAKRVNLEPDKDLVAGSANNFYQDGITDAEVDAFYKKIIKKDNPTPISYGLNSTMIKKDGKLVEDVWKADGRYGGAITQIIYWL